MSGVGRRSIAARGGLSLDFTQGFLDPRITFARTGSASYFDQFGVLQSANSNQARFDHDPAVVDTNIPHNLIPRSKPTGGVPGVVSGGTITGTLPTGWRV